MKNSLVRMASAFVFLTILGFTAKASITTYVCFESGPETFSYTILSNASAGDFSFAVTNAVPPGRYRLIVNPGGVNEETLPYSQVLANTILSFSDAYFNSGGLTLAHDHAAGEPVTLITDGKAIFSYYNDGAAVVIPKGILTHNYVAPGTATYPNQTSNFLAGRQEGAWSLNMVSSPSDLSWYLNGIPLAIKGSLGQVCGTMSYQGSLSTGSSPANGSYDLQFQGYDLATGGTEQGPLLNLADVPVVNGFFNVQLKYMSTLAENPRFRFLQIGVRPSSAPDTDPFAVLTPRQSITSVPFAVNATFATNASNATNATTATTALSANTATTANSATTAANAANADNLGGLPASSFLTGASPLNQQIATVRVNGSLTLTNPTAFTLIPGLTQTVTVPANSSVFIATDGGVNSLGSNNTYSVVDIGIFIDGTLTSQRRVVVNNSNVADSIENWSTMYSTDLPAGTHTVEVRAAMIVSGQNALIDTNAVREGQLTVMILRK